MKKNLFDLSLLEKTRILEMHYNAAGKTLMTEQSENQAPDLSKYDWSKGGTVDFFNANTADIINYIIARDAGKDYTKLQVYMPVMEWYKNVKNKKMQDSAVKESLYLWVGKDPYYGLPAARAKNQEDTGGTDEEFKIKSASQWMEEYANDYQTKVIDQLNGTSEIDGKVKAQLAMIPTAVRTGIKNKVFIPGDVIEKLDKSLASFVGRKDKVNSDPKVLNFLTKGGYQEKDVALATASKNSIYKILEGGKSKENIITSVSTSDADRMKLLSDIQTSVDNKIKNPASGDFLRGGRVIELTIPKVVSEADLIQFTEDPASIVGSESGVGVDKQIQQLKVLNFSYPNNETPQAQRDAQADNFFGDDKTNISDAADTAMKDIATQINNLITELQTQYTKEKVEVISIGVATYSSTSTVNSSFGTGEAFKTPKAFNRSNNVRLSNSRLDAMDSAFKEILTQTLGNLTDANDDPLTAKIQTLVKEGQPNKGPEWNTMGGSNYGDSYGIDSYGPLYRAAYEKNKITPRQFYSQRKDNQDIKNEYEQTYAGFRKSMVGISIVIRVPEELAKLTPKGEYVISTAGNFSAVIQWYFRKGIEIKLPKFGKLKLFSKRPRVFTPPSGGSRTSCPKW